MEERRILRIMGQTFDRVLIMSSVDKDAVAGTPNSSAVFCRRIQNQ